MSFNRSDTIELTFDDFDFDPVEKIRNGSVDLKVNEQTDETQEMIKLNYDRSVLLAEKDFSKKSYSDTQMLKSSFNELTLHYAEPAALMCLVNPFNSEK